MMLLNFRNTICDEEEDCHAPARLAARCMSELPAPAGPKKGAPSSPSSGPDSCSWRVAPLALPEVAEDSWLAQQRKRDTTSTPDDDANVVRAARSILNKLTVEKFDSLFEQLTTCGIKRPHHISILMREIFEKATVQHQFIPMYAELCVQLEKDPRIAAVVEETDKSCSFRRLLLNECQTVFEQVLEMRGGEAEKDPEIALCQKQRALGNMKLIGQLLVHGMLSSNLFVECCEALLKNHSRCPEALDALVPLMMVAGPKFDNRTWQYYLRLGKILSDMG